MEIAHGPDFIIVGAMKAGTTTLFRSLEQHPGCRIPAVKEPEFFIDDQQWSDGISRYYTLFDRPAGMISGEASVGYTSPSVADIAATRIAELVPEVKLIFIARNPITRLRSHYRHEVQRGRESRVFSVAVDQESPYVQRSLYSLSLAPFLDRFPRPQLKVLMFESLYGTETAGKTWSELLDFLELASSPLPKIAANVTAEKQGFSRLTSWAWDRGIRKVPSWLPQSSRALLKRVLLRDDENYRDLMRSSEEGVSQEIRVVLAEDTDRFAKLLGIHPPWEVHAQG